VLNIRGQDVILDKDVAALYHVETREINQAVKNNPDKFPEGYIISLVTEEWSSLKMKIGKRYLYREAVKFSLKSWMTIRWRSQEMNHY